MEMAKLYQNKKELLNMNVYKLGKFKITTHPNMLVTFSKDNKIMVVTDRKENEIHCFIEFTNEKLLISNGWNIKYILNENELELQYNFINE
ncbi:hypothetical protein QYB64_003263 [Clostridium perfringens]|nr:hypothetical protein [Clostridium perfringens]